MRSRPSPPESRRSPERSGGWGITVYAGRFGAWSWSTEDGRQREPEDPRASRWGVLGARRHGGPAIDRLPLDPQRRENWPTEPNPVDDDDPVGGLEGSYRPQDVPDPATWTISGTFGAHLSPAEAAAYCPGPRGIPSVAQPVGSSTRRAQGVLDRARLAVVPNLSEPVSPEARGAVDMCQRMLTP